MVGPYEGCAHCVSKKVGPLCVVMYPRSSFRYDLSFSSVLKHFSSISSVRQQGCLLNLCDKLRRKFSTHRPFEGGYKATSGISMGIYCHLGYPLALDQGHAQTKQFSCIGSISSPTTDHRPGTHALANCFICTCTCSCTRCYC